MSEENSRGQPRTAMLKGAKIIYGTPGWPAVVDCLVVDSSKGGMRVRTIVPTTVPEWVTLKFQDGTTLRANRRWARGNEIGFALAEADSSTLLDAMIAGLTHDQRRALIARIEASMAPK